MHATVTFGRKFRLLTLAVAVLNTACTSVLNRQTDSPVCPTCWADIALYDPPSEPDGVWEEEVRALESVFRAYGWSYQSVSAGDINRGVLGAGENRRFRVLVAPGGYATYRRSAMTAEGNRNIRSFISSGGGFIGLCAGAYSVSKAKTPVILLS